jgi:hypothetical protein
MAELDQSAAEAALDENASTAQSVMTRDGSVTSQPLRDQIRWANRKASMAAAKSGSPGFRVFQVRGGNCVDG